MADYSQLMFNPFDPGTITELEKYEEFQFTVPDKAMAIAFLIIMYDMNSDMKKLYPDNLYERKRNSAIAAGFKIRGGKFDKWVEDLLVGENEQFNDAILRYIRLSGIPDAPAHMVYTEILDKQLSAAMHETDPKILDSIQKNIENAMSKVAFYERKIFGGDETVSVRAALYRYAERMRLNLRPEEKAEEIEQKRLNVRDPYYRRHGK